MIYLYIISWYLLGSISLLLSLRKIDIDNETTIGDLLLSLTIGGLGGIMTILIALPYVIDFDRKWLKKKLF
jgi:hypothetical protein